MVWDQPEKYEKVSEYMGLDHWSLGWLALNPGSGWIRFQLIALIRPSADRSYDGHSPSDSFCQGLSFQRLYFLGDFSPPFHQPFQPLTTPRTPSP